MRRGGGSAGRVLSLNTAAVESEASESSFFSLSLARRPRGFRIELERNEVCINPSLTLDNFVGRQGGGPVDLGSLMITSSRACFQMPTLPLIPYRPIEILLVTVNPGGEARASE